MNSNELNGHDRELLYRLVRYMQKNPEAKHTAEGIARWWIMEQKFEEEFEKVEKVLKYLTEQGVLQKIALPQNQLYYRINNEGLIQFIEKTDKLNGQFLKI